MAKAVAKCAKPRKQPPSSHSCSSVHDSRFVIIITSLLVPTAGCKLLSLIIRVYSLATNLAAKAAHLEGLFRALCCCCCR